MNTVLCRCNERRLPPAGTVRMNIFAGRDAATGCGSTSDRAIRGNIFRRTRKDERRLREWTANVAELAPFRAIN